MFEFLSDQLLMVFWAGLSTGALVPKTVERIANMKAGLTQSGEER